MQEFFAGGATGGGGKFEDAGHRDIASATGEIAAVLAAHGLGAGDTVIDVGAGTGLLLSALNAAVGADGKVLAVDIAPKFISFMKERIAREDLQRVEVSQCSDTSVGLPPGVCAKSALLCDVYHHFVYPKTFMRSLAEAMDNDGHVVVIDFHRDPSKMTMHAPQWALDHIRAGREEFQAEIEAAGFKLVAQPDIPSLTENYCMVFAKA